MENLISKIDPTHLPVCPVCLNDMSKLELIITSCGHSFCNYCWEAVSKNNETLTPRCPECNVQNKHITKNYAAMKLGEYIVKCHE